MAPLRINITGKIPDAWRDPMSLRWVLLHMIEECARRNGHADLLRCANESAAK